MDAGSHERGREVRTRVLIAAAAAAVFAAPAQAAPTTGRLLVVLDQRPGAHAAAAWPARVAGPVVPRLHLVTVRPPAGAALHTTARLLRALPGVRSVEVEHRFSPRFVPNDPALSTPEPAAPAVPIEWWAAAEGLPAAWDISKGHGVEIAVIDTGADPNHPDLVGSIDRATDNDFDPGTGASGDEVGHGTHVASLACAHGNNHTGLVGAGLFCHLLIFKSDFSDSSVAQSIMQAVDQGADAINMSFGTDGTTPAASVVTKAIDYAYDHGVVMAAAAADDPLEEQGDPSNVLQPTGTGSDITRGKGLSVTAANHDGGKASFAGFGSQVSIAAYGTYGPGGPPGIFGAFPGNQAELEVARLGKPGCGCRTTFNGDNRYAYLQGTSMATPMVAAVGGLIRHLNPDLGAGDIIELMKKTARRPAGTGWTAQLGWGILDAGAALKAARKADKRAPKSRISSARTVTSGKVRLRFTSSDKAPSGCVASKVKSLQVWRSYAGHKARRVATTAKSSLTVKVTPGRRYSFFTRAVDHAGNREAAPKKPDVRVG